MLKRLRDAGLLWPTLLALPALGLLIGLGAWQMQRKAWKDGLQRQISERVDAAPEIIAGRASLRADATSIDYLRVRARGRFLHGQERLFYWPTSGGPGWLVHTPLVMGDGSVLVVNRGWVPDALKDPARRSAGQVPGETEVVGLVRTPEQPGTFTPANEPGRNIWFWRDLSAMLSCRGADPATPDCKALGGAPPAGRAGIYVDAEATPANPGGWPRGGATNLTLANRHLEYAGTWLGLAATLVGVYLAFALGRLRQSKGD